MITDGDRPSVSVADGSITKEKLNSTLLSSLFYAVGDTLENAQTEVFAHLTSSKTQVIVNIPLDKSTAFVSNVSISLLKIGFRIPTGGYLDSDAYNYTSLIQTIKIKRYSLEVTLQSSNQWSSKTNNIPLVGYCNSLNLTFS